MNWLQKIEILEAEAAEMQKKIPMIARALPQVTEAQEKLANGFDLMHQMQQRIELLEDVSRELIEELQQREQR